MKSKNYSRLRKDFEKDFFIGNIVKEEKKVNNTKNNPINYRSQKKGRLWVGRPVLLFDNPS